MIHPHVRGRSLADFGEMEILRELVPVSVATDDNSQREKCQNAGAKELPYRDVDVRVARALRIRALNMRLRRGRDGEFVVHDVLGSSTVPQRFYQYRLGRISFCFKFLITGVTREVHRVAERRDNAAFDGDRGGGAGDGRGAVKLIVPGMLVTDQRPQPYLMTTGIEQRDQRATAVSAP